MRTYAAKVLVGVITVTVGLLIGVGAASAGGWAMTSLDAAPHPVAGRTQDVGFTIRQHGVTPVNPTDGDVGISVRTASGAEEFFAATATGATGHFVARVRIDEPGSSTWQVRQGWFGPQELGRIDVVSQTVTAAGATRAASGSSYRGSLVVRLLLPVIGIGLGAFAVADALAARRRRSRDLLVS